MNHSVLEAIRANDQRALSRIMSQIERDAQFDDEFYIHLHACSQSSIRIGLTGPPGAGKSTLADRLIRKFLDRNQSVGVIAVDPTSPFTGGALLGDRIRMNAYAGNSAVYIRSLGSGGDLGGLTRQAGELGDVLAASGKDVILFETVGVGQGELDVVRAVDLTIVILVPESGDEIQLMKAGLIEIADLFVINKSDREGAARLGHLLCNLLQMHSSPDKPEPAVHHTVAHQGTGIDELFQGIQSRLDTLQANGWFAARRLERHRQRVFTLIRDRLLQEFWTSERLRKLEQATHSLDSIQDSPYLLVQRLLEETRPE